MGTYGDEVINLQDEMLQLTFEELVRAKALGTRRRRLYVPPGSHRVAAANGTEIVIPPTLELWFVRGAQLVFVNDITLRILGRVLAEPTQIFDLRDVRDLAVEPGTSRIIFEGEEQEEIHPEWFGAVPVLRGDLVGLGGQLSLASELTANALGTAWLKVDPSAVRGYVDAWNVATYLDRFKSTAFERAGSGAIASMVRSIKQWVIEFAEFIWKNRQSEFERFVRPSDRFRMSLDSFEGQA